MKGHIRQHYHVFTDAEEAVHIRFAILVVSPIKVEHQYHTEQCDPEKPFLENHGISFVVILGGITRSTAQVHTHTHVNERAKDERAESGLVNGEILMGTHNGQGQKAQDLYHMNNQNQFD